MRKRLACAGQLAAHRRHGERQLEGRAPDADVAAGLEAAQVRRLCCRSVEAEGVRVVLARTDQADTQPSAGSGLARRASGRCGSRRAAKAPEVPLMPARPSSRRPARLACSPSARCRQRDGKTRPPSLPSKQGLLASPSKHDTQEALPSRHSMRRRKRAVGRRRGDASGLRGSCAWMEREPRASANAIRYAIEEVTDWARSTRAAVRPSGYPTRSAMRAMVSRYG